MYSEIFMFFIVIGLASALAFSILNKKVTGTKIMLLGISLTLFGVIVALDRNYSDNTITYIIAIVGLIVSIIGLVKKN